MTKQLLMYVHTVTIPQ